MSNEALSHDDNISRSDAFFWFSDNSDCPEVEADTSETSASRTGLTCTALVPISTDLRLSETPLCYRGLDEGYQTHFTPHDTYSPL